MGAFLSKIIATSSFWCGPWVEQLLDAGNSCWVPLFEAGSYFTREPGTSWNCFPLGLKLSAVTSAKARGNGWRRSGGRHGRHVLSFVVACFLILGHCCHRRSNLPRVRPWKTWSLPKKSAAGTGFSNTMSLKTNYLWKAPTENGASNWLLLSVALPIRLPVFDFPSTFSAAGTTGLRLRFLRYLPWTIWPWSRRWDRGNFSCIHVYSWNLLDHFHLFIFFNGAQSSNMWCYNCCLVKMPFLALQSESFVLCTHGWGFSHLFQLGYMNSTRSDPTETGWSFLSSGSFMFFLQPLNYHAFCKIRRWRFHLGRAAVVVVPQLAGRPASFCGCSWVKMWSEAGKTFNAPCEVLDVALGKCNLQLTQQQQDGDEQTATRMINIRVLKWNKALAVAIQHSEMATYSRTTSVPCAKHGMGFWWFLNFGTADVL